MLFSYVSGQQWIGNNKKWRWIAGNFDCHEVAAARCGGHHPIEHIQGFTRSHWMPPSGECLRRIPPAAAMVDGFIETTLNTNKTQLLASNYDAFWSLVVCENFNPKTDPLLGAAFIKKRRKFHVFFFQNWCSGTKTKVRLGCRPSSPILSIPFSSKIDPLGIYHLSLARHTLDSGFTVARGQHSRTPLWSQNRDSCASRGKFYAKSCKFCARWYYFGHDHDQLCPWQGRTLSPPAKRLPPPSLQDIDKRFGWIN